VSFYVGGQQVLVQRCTAEDAGAISSRATARRGRMSFSNARHCGRMATAAIRELGEAVRLRSRAVQGAALAWRSPREDAGRGVDCRELRAVELRVGEPHQISTIHPARRTTSSSTSRTPSLYRAQLADERGGPAVAAIAKVERVGPNALDRDRAGLAAGPRPADERQPYKTALKPALD